MIQECFPQLSKNEKAKQKLKEMIPTHDIELSAIRTAIEIEQYNNWSQTAELNLGLLK